MDVSVRDEAGGRIACITLERPDSYNAFTRQMLADLVGELQVAFADPRLAGVVLTGSGRAFSAGQDLGELIDEIDLPHGGNDTRLSEGFAPLALALGTAPIPVVAAVNGVAAGAGLSLAALCTARVLSQTASFVPAFIELGLVPDTGATKTIPALIGRERALRWLIDGRRLQAEEALAWGLADAVVAPDRLIESAVAMAVRIGGRDAIAVSRTRTLLEFAETADLATAVKVESSEQVIATDRDEFRVELTRLARAGES